jgi:hypothetical protein
VPPRVENPVPETVGLGTIFGIAGAGGMFSFVIATLLNLPERQRDAWGRWGTAMGLLVGALLYLSALLAELL